MPADTDRIEKTIVIRAPRSRVWQAVSDSAEFGTWFGARFNGPFTAGTTVGGKIVDQPGYEDLDWDLVVERVEPETLISFRWHPGAPEDDVSAEPMTLIEFRLEDVPEGTRLTVTESGFDRIPLERRAKAFEQNAEGWEIQVGRVRDYVEANG
jgi:uncharacterized protein YndB with AHSA1/START domain